LHTLGIVILVILVILPLILPINKLAQ